MSGDAGDEFTIEECAAVRSRYVIDRIDGQPMLLGFARCPRCEVRFRVDPRGEIEMRSHEMEITFRVSCMACGRKLSIGDTFPG